MYRELLLESQLLSKLKSLKNSPSPVYLYFTANKESGGKRWCPDCVNAEPVLEEAFECLPAGAYVLQVDIPKSSWKGAEGANHPFRKAPFALQGIPSLCLWDTKLERVQRRFTEGECEQLEALQEMMMSSADF